MLTLIADSNVAHLSDYFNTQVLGYPIHLVTMAGRDIDNAAIKAHQPDALIIRSVTKVDAKLLADNDSVRFVGSATIGTDHVDQAYLNQHGIHFTNAAGCSKHSVAQYVMTAILNVHPNYWQQCITLGVIGLGNIGSALTRYAQDMGWRILGYDPLLPTSTINNASFEDLLSQSDVISLHVPLSTEAISPYPTYHMIDKDALKRLQPHALLINSARGQVIKQQALLDALNHNHTAIQAVLDVFEHEPIVCASLIRRLAIATPHIAGYTLEGKLRGTQMVFDKFIQQFADTLNVCHSKLMNSLLPPNPYQWSHLKAHPNKLTEFYDIKQDDRLLNAAIDPRYEQVLGSSFDALRRSYLLRREWLYDNSTDT